MTASDDFVNFNDYQWVQIDSDNFVTFGLNEEGAEQFDEVVRLSLPCVGDVMAAQEVCGEIEADDGSINLYCPLEGTVTEVNLAVIQEPNLIQDDPYGDGWLFRMELEDGGAFTAFREKLESDEIEDNEYEDEI